jgi:hypothetical protein
MQFSGHLLIEDLEGYFVDVSMTVKSLMATHAAQILGEGDRGNNNLITTLIRPYLHINTMSKVHFPSYLRYLRPAIMQRLCKRASHITFQSPNYTGHLTIKEVMCPNRLHLKFSAETTLQTKKVQNQRVNNSPLPD